MEQVGGEELQEVDHLLPVDIGAASVRVVLGLVLARMLSDSDTLPPIPFLKEVIRPTAVVSSYIHRAEE